MAKYGCHVAIFTAISSHRRQKFRYSFLLFLRDYHIQDAFRENILLQHLHLNFIASVTPAYHRCLSFSDAWASVESSRKFTGNWTCDALLLSFHHFSIVWFQYEHFIMRSISRKISPITKAFLASTYFLSWGNSLTTDFQTIVMREPPASDVWASASALQACFCTLCLLIIIFSKPIEIGSLKSFTLRLRRHIFWYARRIRL